MMDELLNKYSVDYDELTPEERESLNAIVIATKENALSVEKIRDLINTMLQSVQLEVSKHDLTEEEDTFLKARLRNLALLSAFLTSPDKAKSYLEKMISGIAGGKG